MFFDTHAHYDDEQFDSDRDALLDSMQEAGVGRIVNPGCTVDSSRAAVALAARYDFIYAAVGIHPEECAGAAEEAFAAIEALAAERRCQVLGTFGCKGCDTFGPFKLVGGIAKGHPNEKDMENARRFYQEIQAACEGGMKR